jgi:hypothetical protein
MPPVIASEMPTVSGSVGWEVESLGNHTTHTKASEYQIL